MQFASLRPFVRPAADGSKNGGTSGAHGCNLGEAAGNSFILLRMHLTYPHPCRSSPCIQQLHKCLSRKKLRLRQIECMSSWLQAQLYQFVILPAAFLSALTATLTPCSRGHLMISLVLPFQTLSAGLPLRGIVALTGSN